MASPKRQAAGRFPGESAKYRAARKRLLKAESDLRKQTEAVARQRRKLPLGGVVRQDYVFEDARTGRAIKLSEMFGKSDTLVVYNYMYGPAMATPCTSCTSILDGLNGAAHHINNHVPFYAIAKSPAARLAKLARARGWDKLPLLSSAGNTYHRDYQGENEKGGQQPGINVFVRRRGKIHHFYFTELLFEPRPKGMDGRMLDTIWPIWNLYDFTPEGRGTDWYPKLSY